MALSPLVSIGEDHTRPCFLFEEVADADDVEESELLASQLTAIIPPEYILPDVTPLYSVSEEVNQQIDWLFRHELTARAPPLG